MGPIAEILFACWSVLTQPGTHTKNWLARRADGMSVSIHDAGAVNFCARGLILVQDEITAYRVADVLLAEAITGKKYAAANPAMHFNAVVKVIEWNNVPERTQAEVRDAFLRATKLAFKRGL